MKHGLRIDLLISQEIHCIHTLKEKRKSPLFPSFISFFYSHFQVPSVLDVFLRLILKAKENMLNQFVQENFANTSFKEYHFYYLDLASYFSSCGGFQHYNHSTLTISRRTSIFSLSRLFSSSNCRFLFFSRCTSFPDTLPPDSVVDIKT